MVATKKLSVSEMDKNPDIWKRYELYKGEPIEMSDTKPEHGEILSNLVFLINEWIRRKNGFGKVYAGDVGIRFGEFHRYSFDLGWSNEKLTWGERIKASLPLMVEVVSESNTIQNITKKLREYLKNGAQEVWLVFPSEKIIQVYKSDGTSRFFTEEESHTPGEWMQGFTLDIKEIWE